MNKENNKSHSSRAKSRGWQGGGRSESFESGPIIVHSLNSIVCKKPEECNWKTKESKNSITGLMQFTSQICGRDRTYWTEWRATTSTICIRGRIPEGWSEPSWPFYKLSYFLQSFDSSYRCHPRNELKQYKWLSILWYKNVI